MIDSANFLVTLGENIALLFALAFIYDALMTRLQRVPDRVRILISGILFSVLASFGMLLPVKFAPGVMVDMRVVIVALAGICAGWQAGIIAGVIVAFARFSIGGVGVFPAVGSILTAALLGITVRRFWFDQQLHFKSRYLFGLGLLLAAQGLAWTLILPAEVRSTVFQTFALPILLMYPLATWLLGAMLSRENARRRAEAYWQALAENAPDHILLIKRDGAILLSSEPVPHNNLFHLIPAEHHAQVRDKLQTATGTRQVMNVDIPTITEAGEIWSYRISAIANAPDTYVVIGTDLTAYQQTIDALIESETQYRNLVENSGISISLYDLQGKLLFINRIGADHFGSTPARLGGQSLLAIFPEPFASRYLGYVQQVIQTGEIMVTEDEVPLQSKLYWFLSYIFPVRSSSSTIYAAQVVSHDLTERHQSLIDLEASEARFRTTFEAAPHGVAIADLNGHFIQVNDALCAMLGYTSEELLAIPYPDITHPDDLPITNQLFQELLAGKIPVMHLEKRYQHKQGHDVWGYLSVALVRDTQNTPLYGIAHIQNRTETKAAEEARLTADRLRLDLEKEKELRAAKSSLFSMFSHDFKNPMASIKMSVSVLETYQDRMDAEARAQKFSSIYTQLDRMEQLLDDVLTLGRLDAGIANFHPVNADLESFCQQIMTEIANSGGAQHRFVFTGSGQALHTLFDQHLMERVLINVIGNAVKYSPANTTIRFTIQQQGDQIVMTVSDEGIGIPTADQQKLFEIFERGSNVGPIKGTGLGLAIVKQAVELHKGQVAVQSSDKSGTTITITLPG